MKIRASLALVGLALSALLIGCGSPAAPVGKTLVYGRGADSSLLDPIHDDNGESVKVIVNVFDTLVTYSWETVALQPGLATSWEHSPDGLTWTFKLRPDVTFHDGTKCDAAAVVFTFNRLIQEEPSGSGPAVRARPYAPSYQVIKKIEAPDPQTVVFHLQHPSAVFLANLAMFPASIVSPAAVEKLGPDFAARPVGSGPYQFERWDRDQELVLKANDHYWGGRPKIDRLIFIPVAESAVLTQQLLRGDIHITDSLPPAELIQLEKEPGIVIQREPGMNLAYLSLNNDRPALQDLRVREAIWHAIDKAGLVRLVLSGQGEPAINAMPKVLWGWNEKLVDRAFDPQKSRELLRAANATFPTSLKLYVMARPRPYLPEPSKAAVFVKEHLQAVGIPTEIITNENYQHFQDLSAGKHDLALIGWMTDNADPDNFLYQLFDLDNIHDNGGNNNCRYRNEDVHRWLKQAQQELSQERRVELYHQVQAQMFADAPVVPLVHVPARVAQRSEVRGYRLHPTGLVRLHHVDLAVPTSTAP